MRGTSLLYLIQESLYISWIYMQRESDINRVAQPFKKFHYTYSSCQFRWKFQAEQVAHQVANFFPLAWEAGMRQWVTVRTTTCTQTSSATFSQLTPAESSFQASDTLQSLVGMVLFMCQSDWTSPKMPFRCHLLPCTHGTGITRQLQSSGASLGGLHFSNAYPC